MFAGIENASNRVEPGRHLGKPGLTVANIFKPICHGGVPVHPGGVLVHTGAEPAHPGAVPVTNGLRRIIPVYYGRVPVLSRFVMASPRFLTYLAVRPGCIKHFNTTVKAHRFGNYVNTCNVMLMYVTKYDSNLANLTLGPRLLGP